jgi:hypothetical protein
MPYCQCNRKADMCIVKKIIPVLALSLSYIQSTDMEMVQNQALELWSFVDLIRASTIATEDQTPFLRETLQRTLTLYKITEQYLEGRYRNPISDGHDHQELYDLFTSVGKTIFAVFKTNKAHEAIAIKVIMAFILDSLITPYEIDGPLCA